MDRHLTHGRNGLAAILTHMVHLHLGPRAQVGMTLTGSLQQSSGWDDHGWDRGRQAGWLSDGQLRGFNVANVRNTTAMNNGRWAGSYDEQVQPYSEVEWGDARWHYPEVAMKTNEKVPIPEFSGEGSEQEVGKSARSYVRKVQVWLRCTVPEGVGVIQRLVRSSLGLCRGARHGHPCFRKWSFLLPGMDSNQIHGSGDDKDLWHDERPF